MTKMPILTSEQLQQKNPEIFNVKPRTGGAVKIDLRQSAAPGQNQKETSTSRQYRIDEALKSQEAAATVDDGKTFTDEEVFDESMALLSATLSGVLTLATGHAEMMSDGHFEWMTKFLRCVKTEEGYHPPNVQGLLNHIQHVREAIPMGGVAPNDGPGAENRTGGDDDDGAGGGVEENGGGTNNGGEEDYVTDDEDTDGERTIRTVTKVSRA